MKVIYGGIGSIVKAALLEKTGIIDTSIYYYVPRTRAEAFFLIGILNSQTVTTYVSKTGSTGVNGSLRNIHKHPLELTWPEYNNEDPIHSEIAQKAEKITKYVATQYQCWIRTETKNPTSKRFQIRLLEDQQYNKSQTELDQQVKKLLNLDNSNSRKN